MIAPKIHLNGSNGNMLRDQYRATVTALSDAMTALRAIEIHGRDYYTIQGDSEACNKAYHTRLGMVNMVKEIQNELSLVEMHIIEQLEERSR